MLGVKVYDNGGKTLDRYTVIVNQGKKSDIYTMSDDPFYPLGMNQYSHTIEDNYECADKLLKEKEIPEEVKRAIHDRQLS